VPSWRAYHVRRGESTLLPDVGPVTGQSMTLEALVDVAHGDAQEDRHLGGDERRIPWGFVALCRHPCEVIITDRSG